MGLEPTTLNALSYERVEVQRHARCTTGAADELSVQSFLWESAEKLYSNNGTFMCGVP